MALSKVTRNYQITIPTEVRKLLHIEIGTLLNIHVEKGVVIISPKMLIDSDQSWFWTKEWQEGEKEVNEARKKGHTKMFRNTKEMRRHFEK
jgi:AbrB family looped-hinge helix DNA binding protein